MLLVEVGVVEVAEAQVLRLGVEERRLLLLAGATPEAKHQGQSADK